MPKKRRPLSLAALSRTRASRVAFAILDATQDESLEYMAASLGLVLKTMCDVKGLDPQDIMAAAGNMLTAEGLEDDNYVTALKTFIRDDVPNPA